MNLGEPIVSTPRYNFTTIAFFARWNDETAISDFLNRPSNRFLLDGWHVRMKLYRKWGAVSELANSFVAESESKFDGPVVAVTLARLRLSETIRFAKWGKPVERQVKNHPGNRLAYAAIRPLTTFSTFSVWDNETEMLNMVRGRNQIRDGESHREAMGERSRRDFHHEFTTMRFKPLGEFGSWHGKSNYTSPRIG